MRREHIRHLVRFGGSYTGLDVIAAILSNADYFVVGLVLGATQLGLYTLGYRVPELLLLNLSWVVGAVLFPALASLGPAERARAFLVSLRYILLVGMPIAAGSAIMAEPVILALFGPKWQDSAPVMAVLTLYAFAGLCAIPAGTAYKAAGKLRVLFMLALPRPLLLFPLLALFVHDGIVAVAWCMAATQALNAVLDLALASRILGGGARGIWRAFRAPLVATLPLVAVLLPIRLYVSSPWAATVSGALLGAAAYIVALAIVDPSALREFSARLAPSAVAPGP
jgi:PST family polysaccharide transporter